MNTALRAARARRFASALVIAVFGAAGGGCEYFFPFRDGELVPPPVLGSAFPMPGVFDVATFPLDDNATVWVLAEADQIQIEVVRSGPSGDQFEHFTVGLPGVVTERISFATITPGTKDLVIQTPTGVFFLEGLPNGSFSNVQRPIFSGICQSNEAKGFSITDADGDGDLDAVISGTRPDSTPPNTLVETRVLKNDGAGNFTPHQVLPLPADTFLVYSTAAGDINNDGHREIAVSGFSTRFLTFSADGTLSFYNTLTGQSQPVATTPIAGTLGDNALADLNGDNRDDFVAVSTSGGLTVRHAQADGSLGPAQHTPGSFSNRLVVGDFNEDGNPDALTLGNSPGILSEYFGTPSGTFGPAKTADSPSAPWSIGLFSPPAGSSLPSMFFSVHRFAGVTQTYLNLPEGPLGADRRPLVLASSPSTGISPSNAVLADVNGDSFNDLVFPETTADVSFCLNKGDGSGLFNNAIRDRLALIGGIVALPPLDSQPDDRAAFGVYVSGSTTTAVIRINSTTTPTDWVAVSVNDLPQVSTGVAAGDFSGDSLNDLIYSNAAGTPGVTLVHQQPGGTFAVGSSIPITGGAWNRIAVGNFDGQFGPDVVLADAATGALRVLLANNSGGFNPAPTSFFPPPLGANVAVGDINGDGIDDLVVGVGPTGTANASVRVLTGNSAGGFSSDQPIVAVAKVAHVAIADLDLDGRNDVLFSTASGFFTDNNLAIVLNSADGLLPLPTSYHYIHLESRAILVADVKGPIGLNRSGASRPSVHIASANNVSPYEGLTVLDPVPQAACAGDLNADGFVDDADFLIFIVQYNILDCADPAMPPTCPADLNGDDLVDDADFVVFLAAYNELLCP